MQWLPCKQVCLYTWICSCILVARRQLHLLLWKVWAGISDFFWSAPQNWFQVFLQPRISAVFRCSQPISKAALHNSHQRCVSSTEMGFSPWRPRCQCCVLGHSLCLPHDRAIHLHSSKHLASPSSGTRDSLTRWGNRSGVSDCYCSCLYLYLLWTINPDDPMKGCDHESQLAEQCYFMEGQVRQ